MPELPEVETIVRALQRGERGGSPLPGLRLQNAVLNWERSLAVPGPEEFLARLPGQQVEGVGRRGKFIQIQLSRDVLLVHLRMSGDLRVEPVERPVQTHDRVLFNFQEGLRLAFNDPRKFGRVWLVRDALEVLDGLGPEPLDDAFTAETLAEMLAEHSRQIKPLLLDQGFIAGLGNIYTDEALHLARIHPLRRADTLSREEVTRLHGAIRAVLQEGIRRNGASIDWVYRGGDFQNHFRVYQRTGEPCPVCGHLIERRVVGQRGTHFCPYCQPVADLDAE